ncbi:MAG: hypothetical protein LUB56_02905 [Coprobacillus sp.]|nr:hypothetical protein [Coprobacillus sp.]
MEEDQKLDRKNMRKDNRFFIALIVSVMALCFSLTETILLFFGYFGSTVETLVTWIFCIVYVLTIFILFMFRNRISRVTFLFVGLLLAVWLISGIIMVVATFAPLNGGDEYWDFYQDFYGVLLIRTTIEDYPTGMVITEVNYYPYFNSLGSIASLIVSIIFYFMDKKAIKAAKLLVPSTLTSESNLDN